MSDKIWRIARWDDVFENSKSRKVETLTWVPMPIAFQSAGFTALLDDHDGGADDRQRDIAPALYGCWCAVVLFAATQPRRGTLAGSAGKPVRVRQLARVTGFAAELFEQLIEWASSEEIKWLVEVQPGDTKFLLGESRETEESATAPAQSTGKVAQQSPTREDKGREEKTTTDKDSQKSPSALSSPVVVSDFDPVEFWKHFDIDKAREEANRFLAHKVIDRNKQFTAKVIWQACAFGSMLEPEFLADLLHNVTKDGIDNRIKYLNSVFRKTCKERGWCSWPVARKTIPEMPPIKSVAKQG